MKTEIKKLWSTELKRGTRVQGQFRLHTVTPEGVHEFCCLGVLCELAYEAGVVNRVIRPVNLSESRYHYGARENRAVLPDEVMEWAGIDEYDPVIREFAISADETEPMCLSTLNDKGYSFSDIAVLIDNNL